MLRSLLRLFVSVCFVVVVTAVAWAQTAPAGPSQAWIVFTLPNEQVTPNWHQYAPSLCINNYDWCADNQHFWEDWNFSSDFSNGVGSSFNAVATVGMYQAVMMLMPLSDVTAPPPNYYADNIQFMYSNATTNGSGIPVEAVVFPKWKYGAEWCYLYASNAPSGCDLVPSSNGEALAHRKMVQLMDYVQGLGGGCSASHPGLVSASPGAGSFNSRFAIWYGWSKSEFPYQGRKGQVLRSFWQTLPTAGATSGCNLQASYITWLDSGYAGSSDVKQVQRFVEGLGLPYWVNTELYSQTQIQSYATAYSPYQTVITGFWNAADITSWAQGMCTKWNYAVQADGLPPSRLGVWTYYDRDVDSPYELYRAYIKGDMAAVGKICSY